jgi:hypothetical protein
MLEPRVKGTGRAWYDARVRPVVPSMTLKSMLSRRRGENLSTEISRDEAGFVLVRITNNGQDLNDATVTFSLPWQGDGHWIARIDPGGHPSMDTGRFEVDPSGAGNGGPLISWYESEISIPGGGIETEIRFFVGVAATIKTLDVRFELGRAHSEERSEFSVAVPYAEPPEPEKPG